MGVLQALRAYLDAHGVELAGRVLAALLILVATWVLLQLTRRTIGRALAAKAGDRRLETLAPAVHSLLRVAIIGAGIVMAASQLGLDVTTVLAGAGVLGLAVGFGAQTLVRDVISGFFLIFDGIVAAGDLITFGEVTGEVEQIGLRMTQIRAFDGRLWYVPNGELKVVGNFTRSWARAIVNVSLAYEQDVTAGLAAVQAVGDAWARDNDDVVLEPAQAQGIVTLGASEVSVRLVIKVVPAARAPAERALALRLKQALDDAGVEIPFPRQVVYHRGERAPASPAAPPTAP